MKTFSMCERNANSGGFAMVAFLLIALIASGSIVALLSYQRNIARETYRVRQSFAAFCAAEAGLQEALFKLQATEDWVATFGSNYQRAWTQLPGGGASNTYSFTNISASDITITSTGGAKFETRSTYRKVQAHVQHPPPEAFTSGFALFGNRVGFHNHMNKPFGFTITSDVHSNGELLFWRGMTLSGKMTAVGSIVADVKPSLAMPATVTTGTMLDGTAGAYYAPDQGQPLPKPIPFPVYDFPKAKALAQATGTYFANNAAFQAYIAARTTTWAISNRQAYAFPSPLPGLPDNTRVLTDSTGTKTGIVSRAVLSNAVFYVVGSVDLSADCNTLLVITNGSIIVEGGGLTVARPFELYTSPTTPAIACQGKIDITDKNHADGDGGPVTIRGIIYTTGECHIHQSDPYNAVSVKGIEVADYVHNCEWFWFDYKSYPGLDGFSEDTGAQNLTMNRWRELPAGP